MSKTCWRNATGQATYVEGTDRRCFELGPSFILMGFGVEDNCKREVGVEQRLASDRWIQVSEEGGVD